MHYGRLFSFFQKNPHLCERPLYRKVILSHLPRLLVKSRTYRKRIGNLPPKYQFAILSSEIASSMVYRNDQVDNYQEMIEAHLQKMPVM